MDVPVDPNQWTFQTVLDMVRATQYEPGTYDFKEVLSATGRGRPEAALSLRRTACAMANTAGGHIIFGVREPRKGHAELDDLIVGIPLDADLAKEFADKVKQIRPALPFEPARAPMPLPNDRDRGIFVVRVPLSSVRPHELVGVFLRRSPGGSAEPMTVYDVRDQMLYTEERIRKLMLIRIELLDLRGVALGLLSQGAAVQFSPKRFDASAFKTLVADTCYLLKTDSLLHALIEIPSLAVAASVALDRAWPERGQEPRDISDPLVQSALGALTELQNTSETVRQRFEREVGELIGLRA